MNERYAALKHLVLFALLFFCTTNILSQQVVKLDQLKPAEQIDNISVHKLQSDHNATSFIIWIKNEVKPHLHREHTEQIYVLAGEGVMTLGDEELPIRAGDYFIIPENMPHSVIVTSPEPLKVLLIQAPEFEGTDRVMFKE